MKYRQKSKEGFDLFLIHQWGPDESKLEGKSEVEPDIRKKAYQNMKKAIKGKYPADLHTMRKWFGMGGKTKPNREMMFHLAISLELSIQQTQEYLKKGLQLSPVQINDYREFIWIYGLEHRLDWEACSRMIEFYEGQLLMSGKMIQESHTEKLWHLYENIHDKEPEDFLVEMGKNAPYFKGYSMTVFECYIHIKEEIESLLMQEAEEELEDLLEGYSFYPWLKKQDISVEEGKNEETIQRYVQSQIRHVHSSHVLEDYERIKTLNRIIYGKGIYQSEILTEIFAAAMGYGAKSNSRYKNKPIPGAGIKLITDKYLSDLIHIATQREQEYQLIRQFRGEEDPEKKKKIELKLRHQRQRCHLVEREDFLPLLHYLAQKKYILKLEKEGKTYVQKEAREFFCSIANAALRTCQMELLSSRYALDALLLSSFHESDMQSLSDIIEEASMRGE